MNANQLSAQPGNNLSRISSNFERTPFSIITVHWNDLEGLQATCRSVADQIFPMFQHVIIDAATAEFDERAVREWCNNNKMVVIISEPDNGIYDGMNKGLQIAEADVVIFLNAGDEFVDNSVLKDVWPYFVDGADFVYGDTQEVTIDGARFIKKSRPWWSCFWTTPTRQQSMFFRMSALRYQFDIRYKLVADIAFVFLHFYRVNEPVNIKRIPRTISRFYQGGISHKNDWEVAKEGWKARLDPMQINPVSVLFIVLGHGIARIFRRIFTALWAKVQ